MSKPKPKVLFLSKYPESGASSRYRVFQYLPYITKFDYEVQALFSEKAYNQLYRRGNTLKKIWLSLKDYLKRTVFIAGHLDADIIYMQREIFAFGPLWAEWLLGKLGKQLIFDMDDALFINKQNKANPLKWDKAYRVQKIIKKVDLVVAGNAWIRDECLRLGAKKAVHFDVAERIYEPLKVSAPSHGELRVLWLGSPTTCKYLKLIEKAIVEVQKKVPLELYLVGGDPGITFLFESKVIPWSKANEEKFLKYCDVGLMPLPDEAWSKGKCGGKARTYMAAGLVPIVSDIGYNKQLIKNHERGYLCSDIASWKEALLYVHNFPETVQKIRATNYSYVASNFDREKLAKTLEEIILSTIVHHG